MSRRGSYSSRPGVSTRLEKQIRLFVVILRRGRRRWELNGVAELLQTVAFPLEVSHDVAQSGAQGGHLAHSSFLLCRSCRARKVGASAPGPGGFRVRGGKIPCPLKSAATKDITRALRDVTGRDLATVLGALLIAGHNLLDPVRSASPLWAILHAPGFVLSSPAHVVFVASPSPSKAPQVRGNTTIEGFAPAACSSPARCSQL